MMSKVSFTRNQVLGLFLTFIGGLAGAQEPPAGTQEESAAATEEVAAAEETDSSQDISGETDLGSMTIFGEPAAVGTTPGSGYYVDTEEIRDQSYDDVNKILRKVPGVYVREEDGYGMFPNLSLRGADHGRSAKVTLMEDGILQAPAPYSDPAAYYSPNAARAHAIEVLKGSSQVRFGPHTTGGAVNYLSTPIPNARTGYLKFLYGTDSDFRNHVYFGDTIELKSGGRVGYLLEGYFRTTDGFMDFEPLTPDFNGDDTGFSLIEPMVKFMWEPATNLYQRFDFKYGYTDHEADTGYLGLNDADFDDDPYNRYPATRFDEIDREQHRTYLKHYIQFTDVFSLESAAYYNDFHRNWFKLDSVNGNNLSQALAAGGVDLEVLRGRAAGSFNVRANNRDYYSWGVQTTPRWDFDLGNTRHEIELGIRFHSDEVDRFQWSVDFDQDADGNIIGQTVNPKGSAGNREEYTDAIALHLQDRITVGRWTLVPGVRYEYLDHEYTDYASDPTDTVVAEDDGSMSLLGGGVGVTFDWTERFQLFGGIHRGFSPPSPRAHLREGLDEETSTAFELGSRYENTKHAFTAEVAGFYTRFDDLIAINNVGGAGSVDGTAENVGEVDVLGAEVLLTYDPGLAYGWRVGVPSFISMTYTDAELASDTGGDPESIFSGGVEGNDVPYIPEFQFTIGTGIEYKKFGAQVVGNYVSEQYATASNTSLQLQPDGTPDARFGKIDDRFLVDVSADYQITESAKLLAGVQNVFDNEYLSTRLPHGPRAGQPRFVYGGMEIQF